MPKGRPYRKRYYRKAYRARKRKGPTVTVQTSQYPKTRQTGVSMSTLYRDIQSHHPLTYVGKAAAALSIAKSVAGMVNAEKKYYNPAVVNTTIAAPATGPLVILPFDGITQGDTGNNRDGLQIRVKSLQFRGIFVRNASATVSRVKWAVVLDNRVQIASSYSWTDLFDSNDLTVAFTNIEDQWKRFKVLKTGVQTLSSENLEQQLDIYIPMSMPVRYDTAGNCIYGRMFIIMASDEATNTPSLGYRYRVRFYDN